jgi:Flp pilus assembly protein CpaB
MQYKDPSRRGRFIVVIGIFLAVAAFAAAFFAINQAQQQIGGAGGQKVAVVVALRTIPARKPIEAADVVVREIAVDATNALGIVSTPDKVIGRVPAITILEGQMVQTNLLASSSEGGQFTILGPDETVAPDSIQWRAVSIMVPDDRAVGGLLVPNQTVDVLTTATINVLTTNDTVGKEGYYTDKSTKITYQDLVILAKSGNFYIIKTPLDVAEEISHLQASGTATFSMVLRPDIDTRQVDSTNLGTTTNEMIERYGLPIPVVYPPATGPIPTPQPTPTPTATPSPAPSGSPSTSPTP